MAYVLSAAALQTLRVAYTLSVLNTMVKSFYKIQYIMLYTGKYLFQKPPIRQIKKILIQTIKRNKQLKSKLLKKAKENMEFISDKMCYK